MKETKKPSKKATQKGKNKYQEKLAVNLSFEELVGVLAKPAPKNKKA